MCQHQQMLPRFSLGCNIQVGAGIHLQSTGKSSISGVKWLLPSGDKPGRRRGRQVLISKAVLQCFASPLIIRRGARLENKTKIQEHHMHSRGTTPKRAQKSNQKFPPASTPCSARLPHPSGLMCLPSITPKGDRDRSISKQHLTGGEPIHHCWQPQRQMHSLGMPLQAAPMKWQLENKW